MIRVALKYCGGCNPRYDREQFVTRMQAAGGDRIQWVGFEHEEYPVLVIVNGCEKACVQEEDFSRDGLRIIEVRYDGLSPQEVIERITAEPRPL